MLCLQMSMIVILTRARTAEPVLTWLMTTTALVSQGTLAETALKVKIVCVTIVLTEMEQMNKKKQEEKITNTALRCLKRPVMSKLLVLET